MIVEGTIGVDAIVEALARIGGKVTWAAEAKPSSSIVIGDVEVENDDAYEALPSSYFDYDEEELDRADPGELHDFVTACCRGDRLIAQALAPRLFASDRNQVAIERGLFDARCTA